MQPGRGNEPTQSGADAPGPSLAYIPGLDGLRALAVIAVLLYHADLPVYGGFLGVESFFVISGFLITALLLHDHAAHGRVRLGVFWWRRARRLLPALFVLLLGVALATAALMPDELRGLGADTLAALGYVTNWHLIAGGQPYFDATERPPLLQHLWSLAVEEQFYIIWPLLFAAGIGRAGCRGMLALALAGAAASVGLMAVLHDPGADPSRIYYGTDTRAGGILLGVALAFVWAPGRAPAFARPWAGPTLDAAGLLALGGLLVAYATLGEGHPLLYRGGIALVAALTAALVAAATHPAARLLPWLLELAPLRWVGLRSYSLYLWHWPVFMLSRPGVDVAAAGWGLQLARIALALGLAALSYRFIEQPVRRGVLERAWRALRGRGVLDAPAAWAGWRPYVAPLVAVGALSVALSYVGVSIAHAARQSQVGAASLGPASPAQARPGGAIAIATGPAVTEGQSAEGALGPTITAETRRRLGPPGSGDDGGAAASPTSPASATPQADAPRGAALDPALAAELQALLDAAVADGSIPGAILSVRGPGGRVWTGASGMANLDQGAAMTPDTRVRIGSLSKMFTAVVALQLVEERALALDEPVAAWLPGLLPDGDAITVRQLLQHTSGLYDYLEDRRFVAQAYADPDRAWAPEELVAYANRFPLSFAPGEEGGWDYSNTNFVVLGMLIEQVSGRPLAEELERRIFAPLGLEATYSLPMEEVAGPQAHGYSRSEGREEVSLSFAFGTANLVTTAGDLRRFGEALFAGELLEPETMARMQTFVGGKGQYDMPALQYGLGLMANQLPLGPARGGQERGAEDGRVLGHIGGINGFRAALWYAPERDILIVLSVNQGATDPNELATAALDVMLAAQGR